MHDKSGGRGKRKRIIKEKAYYERIKRRLRRKNTRKYTHTTEKERERKRERRHDIAKGDIRVFREGVLIHKHLLKLITLKNEDTKPLKRTRKNASSSSRTGDTTTTNDDDGGDGAFI